MRRQLHLLLALALAASGVSAHAAPHTDARRAAAFARWSQQGERLARHLPLDPAVRPAVIIGSGADTARLMKAGDLDHDGAMDLVDVRTHETYDPSTDQVTETTRLEAHRGRDGRLLWSVSTGEAFYTFPIATAVGANGAPGLVVVRYGDQSVDTPVAGGGTTTATVTAYDGAGKQVWTRALNGAWSGSLLTDSDSGAMVTGVFDAIAGGGSEVLVEYLHYEGVYASLFASSAVAQLVVLDGKDGTPHPFGGPMASTMWPAEVSTVPDLDGDKREDAVALTSDGNKTVAYGISGATGKPVWVSPTLPDADDSFAVPAGDVTGDGVGDIVVSHDAWSGIPIVGDYVGGRVTVLDGKAGTVKWTKPGAFGYALGNTDGKGGAEVAVVDWIEDRDAYGFTVTAYDGSGTERWAAARSLPSSGDSESADVEVGLVGDVEADGAADLGYYVSVDPRGGKSRSEGGTISGRAGRVLRDPVPGFYAILVSFDGHGDDAYTREIAHGQLTVVAWHGDGSGKLWRTSVKAAGSTNGSLGAYLSGGRCADLVISTRDGSVTTDYAFSGATGLPLWSLVRVRDAAPVVKKVTPAKHHRYAKTC